MSVFWQIPRNCLGWILIAQLALIAPHFQRLPWWVLVAYATCALWRIMVFQGRWSFPPKFAKVLLSLLCFLGIWRTYGTLVGLEPTVALLFSGFCLKLLEIEKKRDVYVVIFLGFFVALTEFLFSQEFLVTAYMLLTILLLCTALVALHQHSYDRLNFISIKKSGVIVLQAIPLMLVLFLVFPRFDPLWKVPLPSHQASTGISDSMSPGDIANLSKSSELAFRVLFEGAVPSRKDMYWRGLVLSEFDGRRWQQGISEKFLMREQQRNEIENLQENPFIYSVIQEPTYQRWLFSLALAYSDDDDIEITSDYRLINKENVYSRIKYDVASTPNGMSQLSISDLTQRAETQLPNVGDPKARAFAEQLFATSNSTRDFINRVLNKFTQEEYFYTLKPPLLGENTIDDFLFTTRKGFCSHYASSFVFLMRAAGIPARVVVGYQGGEINPITGTVLVHQFDAHSWAEVWISGEGWLRVDPTAAVAPGRIEFGLQDAMEQEGSFLEENPLSPMRYRDVQWLNKIRLQVDAFNYYWNSWVLQYQDERQTSFLKALLGGVSPWRIGIFILSIGGVLLLLVAYGLLKGRAKRNSTDEVKAYLKMCKRLEKAGFKRGEDEGAIDFAKRVAEQQRPWKNHLMAATRTFVTLSYEPLPENQYRAMLKKLRKEVTQVTLQLRLKA